MVLQSHDLMIELANGGTKGHFHPASLKCFEPDIIEFLNFFLNTKNGGFMVKLSNCTTQTEVIDL